MVFKPGESGNPEGGKLKKHHQKRIASELLSPHVNRAVERIAQSLNSEEREDYQWAANIVMNYVFGKPAQAVDLGAGDGATGSFKLIIEKGGE